MRAVCFDEGAYSPMSSFEYHQFLYGADNYGVLMHDPDTGHTAAIDAGDLDSYLQAITETGWSLSHILVTHHHPDHTDGLIKLAQQTGAAIFGPAGDRDIHLAIENTLSDGDQFDFAGHTVQVIATPGHTLDMLNFYLPQQSVCFTGDTLFALGCGRIFEGTPQMMWNSLEKLMMLPAETLLYSSHEYTAANARFAVTIDPDNTALAVRVQTVEALRADNQPTVPSLLSEELATNPFLRAGDPSVRQHVGMDSASDEAVFAEIRARKDNF